MALGDSILDLVAGAGGHTVNRPALSAAVMQGQAMAGLHTAQTEEALLNAQRLREEQDAGDQLEGSYATAKRPDGTPLYSPSEAHQLAIQQRYTHGSFKDALDAKKLQDENANRQILSDPNQLGSPTQTAAQQGVQGKVAEPFTVPNQYDTLPGAAQPNVQQTPYGSAETADKTADAALKNARQPTLARSIRARLC